METREPAKQFNRDDLPTFGTPMIIARQALRRRTRAPVRRSAAFLRSCIRRPFVFDAVQSPERDVPDYLEVDHSKMTATFLRMPGLGDVPFAVQMEPQLVVEYYAKN